MKENKEQLGHLAPKGYRYNSFNYIVIDGSLKYCDSHNFVYNVNEEKKKIV
jgi:hypothetical protein